MNELPPDFPHDAPTGYRYETIPFTTTVDAIWTISNRRFNYNDGDESRTIWGFVKYRGKTRRAYSYHAPIRANKVGKVVDLSDTTPYSAMPKLKDCLTDTV